MRNKISLIITCKGTKKNDKVEKCKFLHNGNWGDDALVNHQLLHESQKSKNSFWLGLIHLFHLENLVVGMENNYNLNYFLGSMIIEK